MPELPEVETIRRGLVKTVLSKKITQVRKLEEKSFITEGRGFDEVIKNVYGQKIIEIRRFGKALVIDLENGFSFLIHLRMTGQLIYRGNDFLAGVERDNSGEFVGLKGGELGVVSGMKDDGAIKVFAGGHPTGDFVAKMPSKHTRVIFEFEDGKLFFNDQRKFGFVKFLETGEVEKEEFVRKLGKEPWVMSDEEFFGILQRHAGANIKAVLLDQHNIAGLGNIYADEALFFAKIDPRRFAGDLTAEEAKVLLDGARVVMERSIASGGSTMATYVKPDGTTGNYLDNFAQVFGKQGQECPRCGGEIQKIRVAGRGTHFCPRCQK